VQGLLELQFTSFAACGKKEPATRAGSNRDGLLLLVVEPSAKKGQTTLYTAQKQSNARYTLV
jgi:hypothetical protein